jgi:hypothetical protein
MTAALTGANPPELNEGRSDSTNAGFLCLGAWESGLATTKFAANAVRKR